ncbi:MAG: glycosyltransferase family 2 protein [Zetaproteobacteria bacterium]|nr:MAG: glycosyltransferase family 2 protein [Zetaproteobacteria bacterium]
MPLSVVIITLNEEANLPACLESVRWAEDILVVDSGSSDRTCEVARAYGARVIEHAWQGFGAQKQFASDHARHDWVLNLDADERVSERLVDSIQRALAYSHQPAAYRCNFLHFIMGRPLRHGEAWPDPHVRLYDRRRAHWSRRPIHEHVVVDGPVRALDGWIEHHTAASVSEIFDKINRYTDLQAAELVQAGKPVGLRHVLLNPAWRFVRNYLLRLGMLDGVPGVVHAAQAAMTSFLKYAKAVELQGRIEQ